MAIGKVDAYATVQAPNVDFGDIALNAQKFQDADLERQKELKVAQLKVAKVEVKPGTKAEIYAANTGMGSYDVVVNKTLQDWATEIQVLNNKEANGGLSIEEIARQKQLQTGAKSLADMSTSLATAVKEDNDSIKTMSKISTNHVNYYQQALSGQGIAGFEINASGDAVATFYKTEKDSVNGKLKYVLGEDGKPQILTHQNEDGTSSPVNISARNIALGDFKAGIIQPTDVDKLTETIVKGTGYNTSGSDTGVVKNVNRYVTSEGLAAIKTDIRENLLKNNNSTLDILSRLADMPEYKDQLKEYDYNGLRKVSEKELNIVTEYTNKLAVSKLDTSHIKDVNLSEKYKSEDRENRFTFVPTTDVQRIGELKMPTGKFNEMPSTVANTSYGFGENIKFKQLGGSKTGLVAGNISTLSYDKESGKMMMGIKTLDVKNKKYKTQDGNYMDAITAMANEGSLSSEGKSNLEADLNGFGTADSYKYDVRTPGADAKAIISNAMGKSWNQIQGEIIKANKQEIDQYNKNKGKNQQKNTKKKNIKVPGL